MPTITKSKARNKKTALKASFPALSSKPTPPAVPFPEEHFEIFKKACLTTWGHIQSDVGDSIPRAEVIELVLDADRCRTYGIYALPRERRNEWLAFYDTHFAPWIKANFSTAPFKGVMHRIFPLARY